MSETKLIKSTMHNAIEGDEKSKIKVYNFVCLNSSTNVEYSAIYNTNNDLTISSPQLSSVHGGQWWM